MRYLVRGNRPARISVLYVSRQFDRTGMQLFSVGCDPRSEACGVNATAGSTAIARRESVFSIITYRRSSAKVGCEGIIGSFSNSFATLDPTAKEGCRHGDILQRCRWLPEEHAKGNAIRRKRVRLNIKLGVAGMPRAYCQQESSSSW